MGSPESPYNVTSAFFNIVGMHLLPKELSSNMGAPNLILAPAPRNPVTFSHMNITKSKYRSTNTDNNLATCLRLATSCYSPDY